MKQPILGSKYTCSSGKYCLNTYGEKKWKTKDEVAAECETDSRCAAFDYGSDFVGDTEYGFLCKDSVSMSSSDSYELCTMNTMKSGLCLGQRI